MAAKKKSVAQDLVQYFCDWFMETYERNYIPNVTRHVPKMQLMVDAMDPEYIKTLIKTYYSRGTGYHTLDDFFANYDRLISYIEEEKKDKEAINKLLENTGKRVSEALKKAKGE